MQKLRHARRGISQSVTDCDRGRGEVSHCVCHALLFEYKLFILGVFCRSHCSRTYACSLTVSSLLIVYTCSISVAVITGLMRQHVSCAHSWFESALFNLPLVPVTECLARWNHNHGLLSVEPADNSRCLCVINYSQYQMWLLPLTVLRTMLKVWKPVWVTG